MVSSRGAVADPAAFGHVGAPSTARIPLYTTPYPATHRPRCTVKRTHAGHGYTRPLAWPEAKKAAKWEDGHVVKDRCEPCHLVHVLQVICCRQSG